MGKAIVIDIDGVILDSAFLFDEIFKLGLKGDAMWDYFHEHCNSPRVTFMKNIISLVKNISPEVSVMLSTSRNDICRRDTEERLQEENFLYNYLYMRRDGDYRQSSDIKREHLKDISKNFEIIAFIDDDLSNCQMAKDEGILALRRV